MKGRYSGDCPREKIIKIVPNLKKTTYKAFIFKVSETPPSGDCPLRRRSDLAKSCFIKQKI